MGTRHGGVVRGKLSQAQDAVLAVLRAGGGQHEPLLVRGELGAEPEAGVVLLEQQLVLRHVRADHVPVHAVRTPGLVHHGVDHLGRVRGEERAVGGLGDPVREQLPGGEVLDIDGEPLVPGDVLGPREPGAVLRDAERPQGVELVLLGRGVRVQEGLLAVQGRSGLHGGRGPVRRVRHGNPAEHLVRAALHGAGEVPPVPVAAGDREVRLLRAVLDLRVDALPQRGEVRGDGLRVGVLGVQVRPDLGESFSRSHS